jgi:hypothetical protein
MKAEQQAERICAELLAVGAKGLRNSNWVGESKSGSTKRAFRLGRANRNKDCEQEDQKRA